MDSGNKTLQEGIFQLESQLGILSVSNNHLDKTMCEV